MAQVVDYSSVSHHGGLGSQLGQSGICGGQSGTGTDFCLELFSFPLSVSYHCGSHLSDE
jgi:hypothetical protein